MHRFHGNLKSLPLYILFGFAIALGFTACDSTEDVGPPVGIANDQAFQANSSSAAESAEAAQPGDSNLVQLAIDSGLTELAAALMYVDDNLDTSLIDLFTSDTVQFTIFAPTDSAFFAFYDSTGISGISDLPAEDVFDLLLYHVTSGRRIYASVLPPSRFKTIQTLLGKKFRVDTEGQIEAIGSTASIIQPDLSASNGIIHVVDGVLVPNE